jgi:hypothetical protein
VCREQPGNHIRQRGKRAAEASRQTKGKPVYCIAAIGVRQTPVRWPRRVLAPVHSACAQPGCAACRRKEGHEHGAFKLFHDPVFVEKVCVITGLDRKSVLTYKTAGSNPVLKTGALSKRDSFSISPAAGISLLDLEH